MPRGLQRYAFVECASGGALLRVRRVKHSASRTSRTPARCAVSEPSPASPSSGDQPTQTVRVRPGERPLRLNALQRWLLGRLRRGLERLSPGNVPNLLRSAVARARGAPADPPPLDDDYLARTMRFYLNAQSRCLPFNAEYERQEFRVSAPFSSFA